MLDNAAPAAEPVATEAAAPAAAGPISTSDLAGLFKAELDAEDAPAAPAAPAVTETAEAAPEAPAPEVETQTEPEPAAEPTEATSSKPTGLLSGMSEADLASYNALPPALQSWVSDKAKGFQADYTRKSQEVSTLRKQTETVANDLLAKVQHYDSILSQFTSPQLAPPDPRMREADPLAYDEAMSNFVQAKHRQEIAAAEQQRNQQQFKALQEQRRHEYMVAEAKKLAEIAPELAAATPAAQKMRADAFNYGKSLGYEAEQLNAAGALDLVTLWKAQRFDAMQKAKAAAKPVPPVVPRSAAPGPARGVQRNGALASAVMNLNKNPTRASLAAAFAAEIASEK